MVVWVVDEARYHEKQKGPFYNRVIGDADHCGMTADVTAGAPRAAIASRQPDGVVIVYPDRGSQFRARSFWALLQVAQLEGSTGRAHPLGTTAMERFLSLLQEHVLDRQGWAARDDLRNTIAPESSRYPTAVDVIRPSAE